MRYDGPVNQPLPVVSFFFFFFFFFYLKSNDGFSRNRDDAISKSSLRNVGDDSPKSWSC
jgi:hypothetical protein